MRLLDGVDLFEATNYITGTDIKTCSKAALALCTENLELGPELIDKFDSPWMLN